MAAGTRWPSQSAIEMQMFRLSAIFVALLVLLTGCGGGDSSVGSSTRDGGGGVTDSEIIIGSHTDLSGPLALQGNTSIRGVRMRFEQANEAGGVHGRKIRFIVVRIFLIQI